METRSEARKALGTKMVTLDELQQLTDTLAVRRREHEQLVAHMRTLRESCRELREKVALDMAIRHGGPRPSGDDLPDPPYSCFGPGVA